LIGAFSPQPICLTNVMGTRTARLLPHFWILFFILFVKCIYNKDT